MIIKQSKQKYIIASYYNSIFVGSLFSKETDPGQLLNKLLESIRPKDKVNKINGMDITIVTTARNDQECLLLLKEFGLPFKNQK